MSISQEQSPLIVRAVKDMARDTTLADEAKERGDVVELHALCLRLLEDRRTLAKAFDSMVVGWGLMRDGNDYSSGSDKDAIAAIERVAHEAIAFAREVVQAMKPVRPEEKRR